MLMATSTTTAAAAARLTDDLVTPILDSQSPTLLRQIKEQGGYAFSGTAALASKGDLNAAKAALEMAWEQLHSGPWHSVLPIWRDAYSMSCLYLTKLHFKEGEFDEALRVIDMGLIMGGMLLREDFDSAVKKVSAAKAESGRVLITISGGETFAEAECRSQRHKIDVPDVVQALPLKSLSCKAVEKRSALSLEGFLRDYFLSGSPVVIRDCMAHWPASSKWNDMGYLKRVAGDRTIPVEVGKNYLCSEWKQELIRFSELLERIQSDNRTSSDPTYLAQHPLFDQINELREDICVPDYCFAGGGELRPLNAWFGPAGTVTPLHHDPHHNILAQVVGRKYIRLYPASVSDDLYPHTGTMLCNSSQVDLDNIDEKEYPKAKDLEFFDCILEEGEMLYIPPKWWHYVRSLSVSFSVSFWWSNFETEIETSS